MAHGMHAGKIAKAVAQVAGGNGGRQAGLRYGRARDLTKLDEALAAVDDIVANMYQE